jgi:histidine triad (HIT) family protein
MKNDCLFCGIITGEIPSEKIYEDETTFAFLDIHPVNRGHTLVIPKTHATNIYDIPRGDFCNLMETVRHLAPLVKQTVNAAGINIGMNNDSAAGQLIFHAHIHVIPRFEGDGHRHWHGEPYKEGELSALALRICDTIEKTGR